MTIRKSDNLLRGHRTPAYVDRNTGSAELGISPATWDDWVKSGLLPPPAPGFPEGIVRWRWLDVDHRLSKNVPDTGQQFMQGAALFGTTKDKRSEAA